MSNVKELKNIGVLDFRALVKLAFAKCETLNDYREISKMTRLEIFAHPDYVKPQTAAHIVARREDGNKWLSEIMGKNAAFKLVNKKLKEGKTDFNRWLSPEKSHANSERQMKFVLKTFNHLFFFVKESDGLNAATPQKIINIVARAGEMKPENFDRAISGKK